MAVAPRPTTVQFHPLGGPARPGPAKAAKSEVQFRVKFHPIGAPADGEPIAARAARNVV
jgi:hypothetical protein